MSDRIELSERLRIGEHNARESSAIEGSIGPENPVTKRLAHSRQTGSSRCNDLAREHVGVNDNSPMPSQQASYLALS